MKAGLLDIQISSPSLLPSGETTVSSSFVKLDNLTDLFDFPSDGPVTALIATPVQFLMAWRIKVISKSRFNVNSDSKIMAFIICIFSLASLAGGIWLGVAVAQKPRFEDFVKFKGAPALWLVSAAVADVLIAGTMVLLLLKSKPSVGGDTNRHIDRILRFTVQTGTLTAVAALTDALLFLTLPHTTMYAINGTFVNHWALIIGLLLKIFHMGSFTFEDLYEFRSQFT
ncbi:hypothetical protein E1B28_000190 [Marasmius oreades]|uniref:DUF6534 domain-containing protein n=1 Tax=Marasmius oreades TaxID=181124 RepID=A0A9P7V0W5_9AGAR|nr:uncharacterized protein E1B28_000190 [Marasmius oreades]KAG7098223.1 hypothetical protein E1B28_000190 [Marasmius oreades]